MNDLADGILTPALLFRADWSLRSYGFRACPTYQLVGSLARLRARDRSHSFGGG